jgi:hypothetical protein
MLDVYAHQGAVKAIQVIQLNNTQKQTGKLFRITYLWCRYKIGIEKCPFTVSDNKINLEYSNAKWFNKIWKFLHKFKVSIHIKLQWPPLLRERDSYLMDIAQEQKLPTKSLCLINQCRLYLQVLTISDITNPTGTQIDITFYTLKDAHPMNTRWDKTKQICLDLLVKPVRHNSIHQLKAIEDNIRKMERKLVQTSLHI